MSPVCEVFMTRDSIVKGRSVGSENSFIAHGMDWKWISISGGAGL